MNKVCVKVNCYKGFSYEETLKGISNAGFKYVELSTSNGNSLGLSQNSSIEDVEKLKNDLNKYGLSAIAIGGNSYLMDDDTSKLLNIIRLAKLFNCKYVDTLMFKGDTKQMTQEEMIKRINFYIPYLEEGNLDLVIELCSDYSTGNKVSKLLRKINTNNIHINYDTGNAIYSGNLSVDEMIEDFKENIDYISFVHLKDKSGAIEEWNFPVIGKGYIPFEKVFDILKINSNESTLAVEIEFTEKGVDNVEKVNQALKDSYIYLQSMDMI